MDKNNILASIFANDPLGLLDVRQKASSSINQDQRLVQSFEEINNFIDAMSKEPELSDDITECNLASRLKNIRKDTLKCDILREYDKHDLLQNIPKTLTTIDDILNDDKFGIFNTDDDIFNLKHVKTFKERESADFIARRKSCRNFSKYEPLFIQCQADLKSGKRKLIKLSEVNLKEKTFFVVNGLLGYLDTIFNLAKDKYSKLDGRIYTIFENGTESNMLFRSLGKIIYENGSVVTSTDENSIEEFNNDFNIITSEDKEVGFIYILKSKSIKPEIIEIENLYKIGYSTTPIENRIKNAINEPTYLMAPVEIISIYKCYNMNPQKFEKLLHALLGDTCLNVDIYDKNSKRCTPREWFIAPLSIIEEAIQSLIIEATAINHG